MMDLGPQARVPAGLQHGVEVVIGPLVHFLPVGQGFEGHLVVLRHLVPGVYQKELPVLRFREDRALRTPAFRKRRGPGRLLLPGGGGRRKRRPLRRVLRGGGHNGQLRQLGDFLRLPGGDQPRVQLRQPLLSGLLVSRQGVGGRQQQKQRGQKRRRPYHPFHDAAVPFQFHKIRCLSVPHHTPFARQKQGVIYERRATFFPPPEGGDFLFSFCPPRGIILTISHFRKTVPAPAGPLERTRSL